ncbi:MAG TPA: SagB/ThcOx family dehydrogenase [Candidatus Krumholzibacteriaceae bacterium]|nr:SagB/ThcOx family dehydrogenase [Candidatus Krumholzibacteriaceae bacterium]
MRTKFILILFLIFACLTEVSAREGETIKLLKPEIDGGRPLMRVLGERRSIRAFSEEELSDRDMSSLLWAAFGVNREKSGKRTAPSAMNWQEIDIYVSTADGLYLYKAETHTLENIFDGDIRDLTGGQDFVAEAPVNLIFVADYSRMSDMSEERKDFYSAADTGFISQNVYLYCASEGLATVVRGMVDRKTLAEKMQLKQDQRVVFAQSVGYPEK